MGVNKVIVLIKRAKVVIISFMKGETTLRSNGLLLKITSSTLVTQTASIWALLSLLSALHAGYLRCNQLVR